MNCQRGATPISKIADSTWKQTRIRNETCLRGAIPKK